MMVLITTLKLTRYTFWVMCFTTFSLLLAAYIRSVQDTDPQYYSHVVPQTWHTTDSLGSRNKWLQYMKKSDYPTNPKLLHVIPSSLYHFWRIGQVHPYWDQLWSITIKPFQPLKPLCSFFSQLHVWLAHFQHTQSYKQNVKNKEIK